MKKLSLMSLVLLGALLLTNCKKETPKVDDGNSNTGGISVEKKNTSLVTKATATWCGPCGSWGWTMFNDVIATNKDKAKFIGLYASSSTSSQNGLFYQASANTLATAWGIQGYPTFSTNGKNTMSYSSTGGIYVETSKTQTADAVNNHANATVVANSNHTLTIADGKVDVKVATKFFEGKTGEFYVAAYLVEDKALNIQNGQTGTVEHHYVYRGALGGNTWGVKIDKTNANEMQTFDMTMSTQATWVSANFKVITVIYEKVGSEYKFVNAN